MISLIKIATTTKILETIVPNFIASSLAVKTTGGVVRQRSLAGYSPWGCKELDMSERLSMHAYSNNKVQWLNVFPAHFTVRSSIWGQPLSDNASIQFLPLHGTTIFQGFHGGSTAFS